MTGVRFLLALLTCSVALAQTIKSHALEPSTTLPIVFTKTVAANKVKGGDSITARTTQQIQLAGDVTIPAGAQIIGHITQATPFVSNTARYAKQSPSLLVVKFDTIQIGTQALPLHVTVRAMADPIASWNTQKPASQADPLAARTLIGGDLLIPSQKEVRNRNGDVVAYNTRKGVVAHLIKNGSCDGGDKEVAIDIYSASACGIYGFGEVTALQMGSLHEPSTLTLSSTHGSPTIWKHTTALLEVLPDGQ